MFASRLMRQAVTVLQVGRGTVDVYGNPEDDVTEVLTRGLLQQQQTRENEAADGQVVSVWTLMLPADTDITSADRVRVEGVIYDVDGDPWAVFNPRNSRVSHLQVNVRQVT